MGQLKRRLCLALLLALLVGGLPLRAQGLAAYLFEQINALRQSVGLPPYLYNVHLATAAQAHSDDMAAQQYVTHQGSDGLTARERALAAGYPAGGVASENIYGGMGGPESAFNWWLESPVHYEQLTATYFAEIGIGVATGGDGWAYYTLVFGMPPGGPPTLTPEPTAPPPTATPIPPPATVTPPSPAVTLPPVTVVVVVPLGSTATPDPTPTSDANAGPSYTFVPVEGPSAISGAIGAGCVMLVGVFSVSIALWIWWRSS